VIASAHVQVPEAQHLLIHPGGRRLEVDRIVALPALLGPAVRGLPSVAHGFIPRRSRWPGPRAGPHLRSGRRHRLPRQAPAGSPPSRPTPRPPRSPPWPERRSRPSRFTQQFAGCSWTTVKAARKVAHPRGRKSRRRHQASGDRWPASWRQRSPRRPCGATAPRPRFLRCRQARGPRAARAQPSCREPPPDGEHDPRSTTTTSIGTPRSRSSRLRRTASAATFSTSQSACPALPAATCAHSLAGKSSALLHLVPGLDWPPRRSTTGPPARRNAQKPADTSRSQIAKAPAPEPVSGTSALLP